MNLSQSCIKYTFTVREPFNCSAIVITKEAVNHFLVKVIRQSYPCNRPWRSIGSWDVEAIIFSRQSEHKWWWGCQLYAPAALYPAGRSLVLIYVRGWDDPRATVPLEVLSQLKQSNDLIGNLNRDLPVYSIVPQPFPDNLKSKYVFIIRSSLLFFHYVPP
jgi:hypothetical protein